MKAQKVIGVVLIALLLVLCGNWVYKNTGAILNDVAKIVSNTGDTAKDTSKIAKNTAPVPQIAADVSTIKDNTASIPEIANHVANIDNKMPAKKCGDKGKGNKGKPVAKKDAKASDKASWDQSSTQPFSKPQSSVSIVTTPTPVADTKLSCSMVNTYKKSLKDYSTDPGHCAAVSKMIALGKKCYPNPAQRQFLLQNDMICQRAHKGLGAKVQRSFRAMGIDRINCGSGKDLNNGWQSCEGGNPFEVVAGGMFLFTVADWASNNLFTSNQQDKWFGRNPANPINTGGGGGTDTTSNLVGPGEPGDTSYQGTVGNSGVPINTPISQMQPVNGIGGAGVYGTNHPIANGASWSGNNTMPSNLGSNGASTGMAATANVVSTSSFDQAGASPF